MKGKSGDKRFVGYVSRVVSELSGLVGDKSIRAYTRADALRFRDLLVARGVAQATVKRNFECIRAIWNFTATENAIDAVNPFSNMNYGNGAKPVRRLPIPPEQLRTIQAECRRKDDEMRWLIGVLSDSGMRLAEAIGLTKDDISLDSATPSIWIKAHPWRPLKTQNSQRHVPAVGSTLWGLKRACESSQSKFLFPRYCSADGNKSDYASSGLNKWLRPMVPHILFKLWLVSSEATSLQNLKIVISIFFFYSIIATCLLIPAFLKLKKEKDKTWFFALIIIVFSVGNLALSIQPILALNSKTTSVNKESTQSLSNRNSMNELKLATVNEKGCVEEINSTLTNYFLHFQDDYKYKESVSMTRLQELSWITTFERFGDFSWAFNAIKSNGREFYQYPGEDHGWQEIIYVEVKLSGILYPLSEQILKNHRFFDGVFSVRPTIEMEGIGFREGNYETRSIYYECLTHDDGTRVVFQSNSKIKRHEYISADDFKAIVDKNSFKRRFSWLFPAI